MSKAIVLKPGERLISGEKRYSAAWLNDRPRDAREALERARKAWQRVNQQMELGIER